MAEDTFLVNAAKGFPNVMSSSRSAHDAQNAEPDEVDLDVGQIWDSQEAHAQLYEPLNALDLVLRLWVPDVGEPKPVRVLSVESVEITPLIAHGEMWGEDTKLTASVICDDGLEHEIRLTCHEQFGPPSTEGWLEYK